MKPDAPTKVVSEQDDLMAWIEIHPGVSDWLKQAVRIARDRDPVSLVNELEILWVLLQLRETAELDKMYGGFPRRASLGRSRRRNHPQSTGRLRASTQHDRHRLPVPRDPGAYGVMRSTCKEC